MMVFTPGFGIGLGFGCGSWISLFRIRLWIWLSVLWRIITAKVLAMAMVVLLLIMVLEDLEVQLGGRSQNRVVLAGEGLSKVPQERQVTLLLCCKVIVRSTNVPFSRPSGAVASNHQRKVWY